MKLITLLKSNNAQALAEFAVVFPMQLMITLGIVQFALVIYARDIVTYAAHQAAWAERVGEDPHAAAFMVCSPIAGRALGTRTGRYEPEGPVFGGAAASGEIAFNWPGSIPASTGPRGENVRWPGWGILRGSADSRNKTHIHVITPHDGDEEHVEVSVNHEFQLIIPFVNWIFSSHRIGGVPHLSIIRTARAPKYNAVLPDDTMPHPPIKDLEEEES